MQPVVGSVQRYAWGDPDFIPDLIGAERDGQPWAELWLGTHPNGPTTLPDGTALADLTGPLPYLLKVLSAAEPLSLQVHPSAAQAADGFGRGIYPDDRAKPELLYALTPFVALCGVRPPDQTVEMLVGLGLDEFATHLATHGVTTTIRDLYRGRLSVEVRPAQLAERSEHRYHTEATWIGDLARRYPNQPSVAVALLLNLVELSPGEVLRLDAGNLHGYLRGSGIELMGASDNVVRGGLTVKNVDVDELLRIIDPTPLETPVLQTARRYRLPTAGVGLTVLQPGERHRADDDELAVDLDGGTWWYRAGDDIAVTSTTFVAGRMGPSADNMQ